MSCRDCENRELGCRANCAYWAEHEAKKAERYAKKKAESDTYCVSQRIMQMADMKRREIRNGRRAK